MDPVNNEQKALFDAVDSFAEAMKRKLIAKQRSGWSGWDDSFNEIEFKQSLLDHIMFTDHWGFKTLHVEAFLPPNLVDIANFCMFLWNIVKKRGDS